MLCHERDRAIALVSLQDGRALDSRQNNVGTRKQRRFATWLAIVLLALWSAAATGTPAAGASGTEPSRAGSAALVATATSTPTPTGTSTFTFGAAADTYVSQNSPTSSYGTANSVSIVGGKTSAKIAFIRFSVAGLPTGARISSALLRLYVTNASTSGGTFNKVSNTTWAESITWNTKPAIDGPQLAILGAASLNATMLIDLSAVIAGNGQYSFAISLPSTNTDILSYATKEATSASTRPQLVIQTLPAATATAMSTPTATKTATPTNTPTASNTPLPSSTPTASTTPTATDIPTDTPLSTATPTATAPPTSTPTVPAVSNAYGRIYYAAPTGLDANPGTLDQPFRTAGRGLAALAAGDMLILRGGEYVENINQTASKGTAALPITVRGYPGERPIIRGLLWLTGADYWVLDGINVTWNDINSSSDHMVKMSGGAGWTIRNCEFWGAKSYAELLISGGATNFYVGYNTIHDTIPSNAVNQDHLIYANNAIGGVIEHNLLYNSPNGRAIKVGSTSSTVDYPRGIAVRYNTMYNNLGPSNIQFSYAANNNAAYRNIVQKPNAGEYNITYSNLISTSNNLAYDNVGWESAGVVDPRSPGLIDGGGNLFVDPQFADVTNHDFRPLNPTAQPYGYFMTGGAQ